MSYTTLNYPRSGALGRNAARMTRMIASFRDRLCKEYRKPHLCAIVVVLENNEGRKYTIPQMRA